MQIWHSRDNCVAVICCHKSELVNIFFWGVTECLWRQKQFFQEKTTPLLTGKHWSNWSFSWEPAFQLHHGHSSAPTLLAGAGLAQALDQADLCCLLSLRCSQRGSLTYRLLSSVACVWVFHLALHRKKTHKTCFKKLSFLQYKEEDICIYGNI